MTTETEVYTIWTSS